MKDMIRKLASGKAVLFVGAGFSKSALNVNCNEELPLASELAQLIGKMGSFNDGGDLKYSADYFLDVCCAKDNSLIQELINCLKDNFTVRSPHSDHEIVMKIPWKRVYTTNYDDLIEISGRNVGKRIETIDIDDPTENYSNELLCVHINGSISNLNHETINSKFKLSRSSYLSSDEFRNSNWNYIFKKDIETCSVLVFVGYSLYDFEIEKILYENPSFIDKVIFIQREVDQSIDTTREDYIFQKYGNLHRIGLSGFASAIEENSQEISNHLEEFYTEAFSKYEILDPPKETIREKDIESFLRHGELSQEYLQEGMTSNQVVPYLIRREQNDRIVELLENNSFLCVTSELGNGKTFLLKEVAIQLSLNGYHVYKLSDPSGSYISDIDKIIKQNTNSVLIVDTYGNYKDLIRYLLSINLQKVKVIVSERTSNHHNYLDDFEEKLNSKDINIDILSEQEIDYLIKILEHTSLWGKYGGYSNFRKKKHVKEKCGGQFSNVLIDILKSTHIKEEIAKLLNSIFTEADLKMDVFLISLLDVMNIPASLSLISDLSGNDSIFSKFSNTNEIRHLFLVDRLHSSIDTKSSIYSQYLLNEHFEPSYIVEKCIFLLVQLDNKFGQQTLDRIRNEIRINLFRFNFIERILPLKSKTGMLVNYYEKIKNDLPHHISNPQYWLQYAMAHIALSNYEKAYRYLQNAYDKAAFKFRYDSHKIDNQKARLNLVVGSLSSTSVDDSMKMFVEADNLLTKHENDVFKFKVVNKYLHFYESKKATLNKSQRSRIKQACLSKLKELDSLQNIDMFNYKQEKVYQDCENFLNTIISSIS